MRDEEKTETVEFEHIPDETGQSQSAGGHRKLIIGIIVTVVALVGLGVGGWLLWSNHQHASAIEDCQQAITKLSSANKALTKAKAKAKDEAKVTEKQVADRNTVIALKAIMSLTEMKAKPGACAASTSTSTLASNAKALNSAAENEVSGAKLVTSNAKAVAASKEKQDSAVATTALEDSIAAAQKTSDSSKGHVKSGDKTRSALSKELTAAKKLIKDSDASSTDLTAEKSKLDKAKKAVTAAVDSKKKSITPKKAPAQKSYTSGSTKSYSTPKNYTSGSTKSYSGSGSTRRYSTPKRSYTPQKRSYTAPKKSYSTPKTTAPLTNSSNGTSRQQRLNSLLNQLNKRTTNKSCASGGYCPIG
jgi:colicin import membrane protein